LLLTGQRRGEIAQLKWTEVKGDMLELSADRVKSKQAHIVPLSTQALDIIASLPRIGDYVFGEVPVSHFDRIKRQLDAHMGEAAPWVVHDLRRTVASGMAKLKIALPVIEKVLNHQSGTFKGVLKVYQLYDFVIEKRHALEAWASYVEQLVSGKSADDKVVTFGARR